MSTPEKRYANGATVEQQRRANQRYRKSLQDIRDWADNLAAAKGVSREQLIKLTPAELLG